MCFRSGPSSFYKGPDSVAVVQELACPPKLSHPQTCTRRSFLIKTINDTERCTLHVHSWTQSPLKKKAKKWIQSRRREYRKATPSSSASASAASVPLTLDTAGGARSGDPRGRIGVRGASDARASLVDEREREALGAPRTRRDRKLAPDTLREPAVDARLLAVRARRVGVETRKFGVEALGVFTVLESERLGTWWGGSWGGIGRFGRCGCGCGCRFGRGR